jgi:hypothetical protein
MVRTRSSFLEGLKARLERERVEGERPLAPVRPTVAGQRADQAASPAASDGETGTPAAARPAWSIDGRGSGPTTERPAPPLSRPPMVRRRDPPPSAPNRAFAPPGRERPAPTFRRRDPPPSAPDRAFAPPDRERPAPTFRRRDPPPSAPDRAFAPPDRERPPPTFQRRDPPPSAPDRAFAPPGRERPPPTFRRSNLPASDDSDHPDPVAPWSETGMPARLREAIASVRRIANDGRLGADQETPESLPLGPTPEDRPLARIAATRRSGMPVVALAIALALALLGGLGLALLYGGRDLGRAAVPTPTAASPEARAPATPSGPLPVVSAPLPPITEIVRIPQLPTPTAPEAQAPAAPAAPAAGALPLPPPPKPAAQSSGGGQVRSEPDPIDRAIDALLRETEG